MLPRKDGLVATVFLSLSIGVTAAANISQSIRWVDCSKNVPSTLDLTNINLAKLPSTLHCGQIDVPMDYSKPLSPNNMITLGLAMHRPAKSKGALFVNPGGSDPAAVLAWQFALNQTREFSGLEDYDMMMMDIRGTFSSNPLNVDLEAFAAFPSLFPQNQSQFDIFRQASATVFQSWIDQSTPPGIIQFSGTREVVRDYEEVRKALGYDKIHFFGASYGSYRAQLYSLTFPDRVGYFVLDATVPYGRSLFDKAQDHVNSINRGMLRADAYCQANPSCPFYGHGKGAVPKALRDVLAAAERAVKDCTNTTNCSDLVPVEIIKQAILAKLFGQPDFPNISESLQDALDGNYTLLLTDQGPLTVESVVAIPLECGDFDYNQHNYSDFQRSLEAGLARDITGIGMTPMWQLQLYCSAWPFPASPERAQPNPHRMLIVTADFDVDSPTEWSTFAKASAPNSTLIVRHGDDHVSFQLENQPSTLITKEFLRTGRLPGRRNETLVSVYPPCMNRAPISDPYRVPTGVVAGDIDS